MTNTDTSSSTGNNPFAAFGGGWGDFGSQWRLMGELAAHHANGLRDSQARAVTGTTSAMRALWPQFWNLDIAAAYQDYAADFAERSLLFLDTLRQRGDSYIEREEEGFKPVLVFDYDLIIDGRELPKPVNYALVRILPPEGSPPQREDGRPFVIIDPRAGHGSGIGGFKSESEVGVALKDGHPVYFVIFYPNPEPGQTLGDVCEAEALFLKEIHARHPNAPLPLVTGNCQGGWASMILGATHPDLIGPLVIAGAPLSYWAGEKGKNPFRYFGGVMGGAVPALFASDLGGGKFDGAHLVMNFESLNPANTWWRKNYTVFADVDNEADRFLDFEKWWSGFYFMNDNEIRWIVENLFVGNKLTHGEAVLPDGTPIDLTRIQAPVVVFASHGDNITPPQQALNWIPDLYDSVQEMQARGNVVVYTLHDSVGHLGIFVSAKVASKQHKQITSVVKTIEALAPGLYEMKIGKEDGVYTVSFEARTIDDILALDDGREEEEEFAAVAQLSEWATKTYELTMRPFVQSMVTPEIAEAGRVMHPMRTQRYLFSGANPAMRSVKAMADRRRATRTPIAADNPFFQAEKLMADIVENNWNLFRDTRDAFIELAFHGIYGTPWMKRLAENGVRKHEVRDALQYPQVKEALAKSSAGGYAEAIIRMLILIARARGSVRRDRLERSNRILHSRPPFDTMTPEHRSRIIHEQTMIVEFAGKEAIATLPDLLRDDVDRVRAVNLVMEIAGAVEEMDPPTIAMFKHIQQVLKTMAKDWHEPQHEVEGHIPGTAPDAAPASAA